MNIGLGLSLSGGAGARFDASDLATGTLVLNFVDPPPMTLGANFQSQTYSAWANDSTSSIAGLTGYYQSKG